MKINLNKLAKEVSEIEGLKEQVNIAQIKEVIKDTFIVLYDLYEADEVLEAIRRTFEKWQYE